MKLILVIGVVVGRASIAVADSSPVPVETHATGRHGFTSDIEIGGGAGEYVGDSGGLGLVNGSTGGESVFDLAAGVGAFITPRVAIGVRGFAAFSRATTLTYTPPGSFETPGAPPYPVHTSLSNEIVVANAQGWRGDNFWIGLGLGYGRVNLDPNNPSHAASGLASDVRVGVAAPYGLEASFELTSITFNANPTGPSTQIGFAFLLGWQFL